MSKCNASCWILGAAFWALAAFSVWAALPAAAWTLAAAAGAGEDK